MGQPFLLQSVVLEIAHQGVHLCHAIADWSTCCKNNAAASGDFIEVAAFAKHIRRFLRLRSRKTGHIAHLRI